MAKVNWPRWTMVSKRELHVVAQIIETELVVGAVGHVTGVLLARVIVVQSRTDATHGQAQETINLAHPLGIASGQVSR